MFSMFLISVKKMYKIQTYLYILCQCSQYIKNINNIYRNANFYKNSYWKDYYT